MFEAPVVDKLAFPVSRLGIECVGFIHSLVFSSSRLWNAQTFFPRDSSPRSHLSTTTILPLPRCPHGSYSSPFQGRGHSISTAVPFARTEQRLLFVHPEQAHSHSRISLSSSSSRSLSAYQGLSSDYVSIRCRARPNPKVVRPNQPSSESNMIPPSSHPSSTFPCASMHLWSTSQYRHNRSL